MNEERYELTITVNYTREEIEKLASIDSDDMGSGRRAQIEACREWLAANPRGMTRDEFDLLPNGTVVETRSRQFMVRDQWLWVDDDAGNMVRYPALSADLDDMTVVSTPAAPTLDDAQFVLTDDGVWYRVDLDDWACRNSKLTTAELRGIYPTAVILLPGPQIGGEQ